MRPAKGEIEAPGFGDGGTPTGRGLLRSRNRRRHTAYRVRNSNSPSDTENSDQQGARYLFTPPDTPCQRRPWPESSNGVFEISTQLDLAALTKTVADSHAKKKRSPFRRFSRRAEYAEKKIERN